MCIRDRGYRNELMNATVLIFIAYNKKDSERRLDKLKEALKRYNLKINLMKTEEVTCSRPDKFGDAG